MHGLQTRGGWYLFHVVLNRDIGFDSVNLKCIGSVYLPPTKQNNVKGLLTIEEKSYNTELYILMRTCLLTNQ